MHVRVPTWYVWVSTLAASSCAPAQRLRVLCALCARARARVCVCARTFFVFFLAPSRFCHLFSKDCPPYLLFDSLSAEKVNCPPKGNNKWIHVITLFILSFHKHSCSVLPSPDACYLRRRLGWGSVSWRRDARAIYTLAVQSAWTLEFFALLAVPHQRWMASLWIQGHVPSKLPFRFNVRLSVVLKCMNKVKLLFMSLIALGN